MGPVRMISGQATFNDSTSDEGEPWLGFRDRRDAGHRLAAALAAYKDENALVLAIPRGGVPVGAEVARWLGGELDIVVARKLGAPGRRELAIGAVTANGGRFLNEEILGALAVSRQYLDDITAAEQQEARRREQIFRHGRPEPQVTGRKVIVVDDGLATGATMMAAVRSVRSRGPARLVAAVPVGSQEACAALRPEVDVVVCLAQPEPFWAVGLYYADFQPTSDEDVERLLEETERWRPVAARG